MTFQIWFTLAVVALMFAALVREWTGPDVIVVGAVAALWAAGIIDEREAVGGFSSPQVLAVAFLFMIAASLRETGAMEGLTRFMLGSKLERTSVLARLLIPIAGLSAVMNNTPIVAMFTPAVRDWAIRNRRAPSKYLMPLSFATVLGGTCTLIGTSTNLTVSGLLEQAGHAPLGMFEMTPAGVPITVVGLLYLLTLGQYLLPSRRSPDSESPDQSREYGVTLEVAAGCPYVGLTVEQAGLRHLSGLFLVAIERKDERIAPVRPTDRIEQGDRLELFGLASTVVELQKTRGLVPVTDDGHAQHGGGERQLFEVVISEASPLVGTNLRDARFRRRYDAAVIAIHRGGERLHQKLGEVELRSGDTLMLEAAPGFQDAWANSRDFYLVSQVHQGERPRFGYARLSLIIFLAAIAAMASGRVGTLLAATVASVLLVLTGCLRPSTARGAVDLSVITVIAGALGVSQAISNSGLANAIGESILHLFGSNHAWIVLAVVYLMTAVMTELLSNNAAAALAFPIAMAVAAQGDVNPRAVAVCVAVAASCGFVTPFGYQTHLMVYGPGGYRFMDFPRVGLPLSVLCFLTAIVTIPLFIGL